MPAKDSKRNEVLAGLVIIVAILFFTITIIVAGNFSDILQKKRLVRAKFFTARGLVVNNPVQVSGVEVGIVKKLSLEVTENPNTGEKVPYVDVVAEIPADIYIAKDTRAEIDVSLTGITVMKLERGSSVEVLREDEYIVGTDAINISELSTKLGSIASTVERFVSEIASQGIVSNAKEIFADSRNAAKSIAQASASLDDFMKKNKDSWTKIVNDFEHVSKDMNEMVSQNKVNVNKTLASLPETSENMRQLSGDAARLVKKNDENLTRSLAHIEQTTKNLKETSSTIKRQPWILLRKPDQTDSRSRNLYTAARDLESSAVEIRNTLASIKAIEDVSKGKSGLDQREMTRIITDLNKSLASLAKIQGQLEREVYGKNPPEP